MCYQAEVQWQFGHVANGSKECFVIECPFSKMCPVRVKFNWNAQKGYFSRESSFAIFHDHCVQRIDLSEIDPETLEEARLLVRQSNKKITASELAEQCRLKPYQATMVIKTTVLTEFFDLPDEMSTQSLMNSESSQLSSMSAVSVSTQFSKSMSLLVADLQHLKDAMPLTTAIYNTKGEETMAFIQTGDMLELYKRNHESGVLINLCWHEEFPSKYGMHLLYFSGVDQELGNILTFAIGLFSQRSTIAMWWILSKFLDKCLLVKKPLRLVFAPLDTKLFKLLSRELPYQCRLYATQHSVIEKMRSICSLGTATSVSDQVVQLTLDLCLTDTEDAVKDKLNEIKYLLQYHTEAYSQYIKHVYNLRKAWLLTGFVDVFNGGLHSFNRTATIAKKLSEPLPLEKDTEDVREDTMYMRRDQHKDSSWSTEASLLGSKIRDTSLSINDLLKHVQAFEEINETFYFKFDKKDGLDNLTNCAQYICVKKAFTPFAAMHMLKQIHLADMYRDRVTLTELKPLVDYTLTFKNLNPNEKGVDFADSQYKLTASSASKGLKELKCSCAFYTNYQMICWHCFHLLERLQIKNMGGFEHLRKWREYVGFKSLNLNDKRVTQTYKVKKNRRLKSFIEEVTNKHKKRLEQVCKEKGITLKTKRIGEQVSSGEENEWEEINNIVKQREEQARQRRRQQAKEKRVAKRENENEHQQRKRDQKAERKAKKQEQKALKKAAKAEKKAKKKKDKKEKKKIEHQKSFREDIQ